MPSFDSIRSFSPFAPPLAFSRSIPMNRIFQPHAQSRLAQLCYALLSLFLFASPAWAQKNKDTVIIGAKAYLGKGKYMEDATLVLRKGKIRSIKKSAKPAEGARVIHADGKIVTVGLTATDSPLGLVEIEAESSTDDSHAGGKHPVHAAYRVDRAFFADSTLLGMALRAGITQSATTPSGGMVSGQVAWADLRPGKHRDCVVEPSVAMKASVGTGALNSRAATLTALETLFDDAILYRGRKRSFQSGDLGPLSAPWRDLAALDPVLRRKQPLLVTAHRASDILATLDLAKRYRLKLAIVGATEGWKVAQELAKAKAWVILRPSDNLPTGFSTLGARMDNAAILHQAGVPLVIANFGSGHNAAKVRQEAGNAVAYGLPYQAALDAITANPAKLYGMDKRYGALAAGKAANLVIWTGDPLEFSSQAAQVFVRGELLEQASRHELLRQRYMDLSDFQRAKTAKFPRSNPFCSER